MASNNNVRQHFNSECIGWIRENIIQEFEFGNSGVMFFDEPQLPHTDVTRDFVLLYNVDTGGVDSEVCFWREKGHPLYRERMLAVDRGPHLELIERINGPFDCWYMMNTRIIHSVENVSSLRINLQISFDTEPPLELLDNHVVDTIAQGAANERRNQNTLGDRT